jgi:iron complex transport system ATP-binding protein
MTEVVALEDAEVRVAGRTIVGPVTLSVADGERWAVLGPNGSGKTTLLRLAGGMRQPSSGTVRVLGERVGRTDLRKLRERIAHVGHAVSDLIPSTLAIWDVVLSGKRSALVPWMQEFDDADRERAGALLERFGVAELDGQALASCSQGERQRVLLARALFGAPELLLLDEPAAGLDLPGREALVLALEATGELAGIPTILVTHHLEELPTTTTHAALLREGRIVTAGSVDAVLTDATVSGAFGLAVGVRRTPTGRWSATAAP